MLTSNDDEIIVEPIINKSEQETTLISLKQKKNILKKN